MKYLSAAVVVGDQGLTHVADNYYDLIAKKKMGSHPRKTQKTPQDFSKDF